jgi:hypothetical protein
MAYSRPKVIAIEWTIDRWATDVDSLADEFSGCPSLLSCVKLALPRSMFCS